jgi:hypothetical protein
MRRRTLLVVLAGLAVVIAVGIGVNRVLVGHLTPDRRASSASEAANFFYMGGIVGYFKDGVCPQAPGRYRYIPCRSGAHYDMHVALRAGAHPRCTLRTRDRTISFAVIACPEYGILELAEFRDGDGDRRPAPQLLWRAKRKCHRWFP